jgi:beta-barrel assembly-enhancing protease
MQCCNAAGLSNLRLLTNSYGYLNDDPELTSYLQQLGERIVGHLPPTRLRYRFFLADWPLVNAFSLSGERVYIPRKLVANARNEDELAAVIGHELGHITTHQQAITGRCLSRRRWARLPSLPSARTLVAATTLTAGVVLVIVTTHMLAN